MEKKHKKQISVQLVIAELQAGKSPKQIAETYGYTARGIRAICKRHGFSTVELNAFKTKKADIFAWKQMQIINSMSPKKIGDASLRDQATAFNILHNAERLERGQTTSNMDFRSLTLSLNELIAEEEKLKAELEKELKKEDQKKSEDFIEVQSDKPRE